MNDTNSSVKPERRFKRLRRPRTIICLLLVALFFHMFGRHIVRFELQRIYTPPALTEQAAVIYTRFVKIAGAHPEYDRIFVNDVGIVDFEPEKSQQDVVCRGFSPEEVAEFVRLVGDLRRVRCVRAEKRGTFVTFVPTTTYILPARPGVLCSLDGTNPNDADHDDVLDKKKPYIRIVDSWYASKGLVICPTEPGQEYRLVEESYFDHSTTAPGVLSK